MLLDHEIQEVAVRHIPGEAAKRSGALCITDRRCKAAVFANSIADAELTRSVAEAGKERRRAMAAKWVITQSKIEELASFFSCPRTRRATFLKERRRDLRCISLKSMSHR
jgi:hypothetical protein